MIIMDLNQVMIANLFMQIGNHENAEINLGMLRHMVLNSIRGYLDRFKVKYGELVIACDDQNYWRKEIFPYYKANRKDEREKSEIDWNLVFQSLNQIREELKVFFPYRVIQVPTAEADDIIAVLTKTYGPYQPIMIISGDKDFRQLHTNPNIKQYDPSNKKAITVDDAELFLKEQIIRGDRTDGVPNFLSQDDSFVMKVRQKKIMTTKVEKWVHMEPEEFCDSVTLPRYYRNKQLIDLNLIPMNIASQIADQYVEQDSKVNDRSHLFNYFIKHKLKNLMANITDF